jgi:hypothetical protein
VDESSHRDCQSPYSDREPLVHLLHSKCTFLRPPFPLQVPPTVLSTIYLLAGAFSWAQGKRRVSTMVDCCHWWTWQTIDANRSPCPHGSSLDRMSMDTGRLIGKCLYWRRIRSTIPPQVSKVCEHRALPPIRCFTLNWGGSSQSHGRELRCRFTRGCWLYRCHSHSLGACAKQTLSSKPIWASSCCTLPGHTTSRWITANKFWLVLATFDPFMQWLHKGSILQDVWFSLYAYYTNGELVQHHYHGGWLLVNKGYLAHSTTAPPFKTQIVEPR